MKETVIRKSEFLPALIMLVIALISTGIYTGLKLSAGEALKVTVYLQLSVVFIVPLLFPLFHLCFRHELPLVVNIIVCIHLFLAICLSSFGFYTLIPCWDKILHGFYGLTASVVLYTFYSYFGFRKLSPGIQLFILFLSVMGTAALWEVFEFTCDSLIPGNDAQRVQACTEEGISPVSDTMGDIIVTMAGIAFFDLLALLNKFTKLKLLNLLDNEIEEK